MKRPPKKVIIEVLTQCMGVKASAAKKLGCARNTLNRWLEHYKIGKDDITECRGPLIDLAEIAIIKAVRAGDFRAAKYVLSCFAGDEWNEKAKTEAEVRKVIAELNEKGNDDVKPLIIWGPCDDDEPENEN